MSGFSELRKGLSNLEALERELNLKQLQINRLLNITQAINNNVSAEGLFNMYKSFLSWEIGVKKMALYVRDSGMISVASPSSGTSSIAACPRVCCCGAVLEATGSPPASLLPACQFGRFLTVSRNRST